MDRFISKNITTFRIWRTKKLSTVAFFLINKGITANHLTSISLVSGIIASYFFLSNWWLMMVFAFVHLTCDSLDGVLARLTTETINGRHFDLTADSIPVILILIKIGSYLHDFFPYLIAGLFTLSLLFYFLSKLQTTFIPLRTAAFITAIFSTLPLFNSPFTPLMIVGYLAGGICIMYSLAKQLQWVIKKK